MNVYWNPETRCAIATNGDLAVFCIVPVDMDPIYWCEEVFCLKNGIHTPYAFCRLIPIHPLTGIPPHGIAPDSMSRTDLPASDSAEDGGGTVAPAPVSTPPPPDPRGGLRSPAIISPDPPPAHSHFNAKSAPLGTGPTQIDGASQTPTATQRRPPFGVSKPYGGRY